MICLPSSSVCFHQLTIPSSIVSKPYLILLLLSQLLGVVKWSLSYSFHSCGPFAVIPKKVTDTSFIRIDCILLSCQFMSFSSMSKSQFVPDSQYVPWDYMVINKDTLRLSFPFQQLVFLMTAVTGGGSIRIIHPFPVDNSLSWSFHSDYLSKHQLSIVLSSMCLHASSWFDDFIILLRCCEISSFAASMLLFDISSSLCRRFFYTPGIPFRGRLYKAVVKGHYPLETGFACALIAKDHITLKDFLKLRQGDRLGSCQCKRSCCYRFKLEQIGGSWAYTHEEGIDVDEVFAPVPRIRSYQVIGTPHGFVDPGSHLRRFIGWSMLCYGLHQVLELVPNLDRKEILYSDVVDFLVKGLIHGMQVKEREETGTIVHVFLCFRLILAGIAWICRCKAGVIRSLFWFAEIVDFLRGSNLRYALTTNPTIYDSLVKQFWQTATANTIADGTLELHATIDTTGYTITEASIRDKLQLADASGITMLPNNEIFEGMGQMGYPTDGSFTFWKSFFTPQWRFLVHHLLHCISSKSGGWDQFGSNIATALICQEHPDVDQTQPSSSTIPIPSTSLPPKQSPPPIPTPIPAFTPTPIPETDPEPMEHTFEEPSPSHQHFSPLQEHAQGQMTLDDLLQVVPQLMTRVDSLEKDLKQTKLTMGSAIVKLVKKVKKLKGLVTPSKTTVNASGEEQVEDIIPTTLEAAKTLSRVASQKPKSIDKGRRYKRRKESKGKKVATSLDFQEEVSAGYAEGVNTGSIGVNTGSIKVSTVGEQVSTDSTKKFIPSPDKSQREGKAPMIKEQLLQEEASLAEAIRLDTLQKEEEDKQVHLDSLLAQRLVEEEELNEQQKKRRAQVRFEAQHYTDEDWDLIREKIEANAELSKSVLGSDLQGEDIVKKMVELVNHRKKHFAEERARAKRNKPMTQSQLKT
ncbi:hypothetical protein Tco_0593435, partial [Tanacetum coccineum]